MIKTDRGKTKGDFKKYIQEIRKSYEHWEQAGISIGRWLYNN